MVRAVLTRGSAVSSSAMCRQRMSGPLQGSPGMAQRPSGRTQPERASCVAGGVAMVPRAHRDVVTPPAHRVSQSVDSACGYPPHVVQCGEPSGSRT